jgi:hypothetical protein
MRLLSVCGVASKTSGAHLIIVAAGFSLRIFNRGLKPAATYSSGFLRRLASISKIAFFRFAFVLKLINVFI